MDRVILHVDMDAFFAAIEQREHPEYKDKPLIVGADPKAGKGRGVVSTCSYEARKYGIHSAMPISQAYRLCPDGIYVYPNGRLYGQVSQELFQIFYEFTDLVEPLSIDEAFLDISGTINLFGSARQLGMQLKNRIREAQHLTGSVGIAPNKFTAKVASDLEKPDGLVIVEPPELHDFLDKLPVSRLWGAGKKTIVRLEQLGLHTIGDIRRFPRDILAGKFGKSGEHFYRLANGEDDRPVIPEHAVKSVSNEHTFDEDISDPAIIHHTLFRLSDKVAYRLREQDLKGRTIHLKLRYEGFETTTRNMTITEATNNTETIFRTVKDLFLKFYQSRRKVRLLGVGVSGFGKPAARQLSIFDEKKQDTTRLEIVEDLIKKRFGKGSIGRAEGIDHDK